MASELKDRAVSTSSAPPAVIAAAPRYQIERKLGEGGSGVVYLAKDHETGEYVALKKLLRVDAKSILRFKREFRSLQTVRHSHLIKLYDMGQAEDSWFLTMEYLDGTDLSTYLICDPQRPSPRPRGRLDEPPACGPRTITTFHQLAAGVHALHQAGLLHRDLKPSNVIVVRDRVVVLDFGLVREIARPDATLTEQGLVAGTPAYMAPEQLVAGELTPAVDWYAFGAMLYEQLSGMLPMDGPLLQLLAEKVSSDPIPLSQMAPTAPRWLSELCMALLQRDPAKRPSGTEVLARFQSVEPKTATSHSFMETLLPTGTEGQARLGRLFGRDRELECLKTTLAQAADANTVFVHVRGTSGAGKSALVEYFLDGLAREEPESGGSIPLVLRSRCYELEAMPFKALDGVLDAIAHHLLQLDDLQVARVLPKGIAALARVFPVLERLPVVRRELAHEKLRADALETRKQAERALRNLLENLAAGAPVIVWIDDLQWGDLDSAQILKGWRHQSSAAPILFVFSYRSDEVATSTCLRAFLEHDARASSGAIEHQLDLGPLEDADISAICEHWLNAAVPGRKPMIESLIRDAQGSPFLASQLIAVARAKLARNETDLSNVSLDALIAQSSEMLADGARRLLELLAVAGRPIAPRLALQAAGVKGGGRTLVHELRGLNLVRTRDVAGVRMLELYHDQVRERVQRGLSRVESQQLHDRLFNTLALSGQGDADWLHGLALGAGRNDEALRYGLAAAERANATLAFDRAVGLYRACLELVPPAQSAELWIKLSLALARCGRGVEAAQASLAAAEHVPVEQAIALTQRAASHYLRCGHFARGEQLIQQVLEIKGIWVPTSNLGVKLAIAWERLRTALEVKFGRLFKRKPTATPIENYELLRTLASDTQAYDPLRAALFQTRAFRYALMDGEPMRLVRAWCHASASAAYAGAVQASDALMQRAAKMSSELHLPEDTALPAFRTLNSFLLGRMRDVLDAAAESDRLFRVDTQGDPAGNYHRRAATTSIRCGALRFFGQYTQLAAEVQTLLEQAIANDNRSVVLTLSYTQTLAEQVTGQGSRSRARLDAQQAELPPHGFGLYPTVHMLAVMTAACFTHDYDWAGAYLGQTWRRFLRAPIHRAEFWAAMSHEAHARVKLNQYVLRGVGASALREARADVKAMEKLSMPFATACAHRVRGRTAGLRGELGVAVDHLRKSIAICEQLGAVHEAARDQYALGGFLGGDEGRAQQVAARAKIAGLGVVDVDMDLAAYYPELSEVGQT